MSSQAPNFVPAGQVATTQQGYNVASQAGSNYNAFNPFGSTTYGQTGTGPGGVPIYSTTQSLSPAQQSLLNTLQGGQQAAGTAGTNLITGADYSSTSPATAIGSMTSGLTGAATGQEVSYLQPYFNYQTTQLDTQLRNQGFDPSSPAYQQAMLNLQNSQGNQVEGFVAQTQPQMFNQATQEYQLPATLGAQLAQWGAPNVAAATAAPGGAALQAPSYESDVSQAENAGLQQESVNNQIWAGILGALGTAGGAGLAQYIKSDARQKRDARAAGKHGRHQLYRFRYLDHDDEYLGVMAQDVLRYAPEAVRVGAGGYYEVNYEQIGVPLTRITHA